MSSSTDKGNITSKKVGYRKLDMSKLNKSHKIVSSEEALKDIIPIQWADNVLSGKRKVVIK